MNSASDRSLSVPAPSLAIPTTKIEITGDKVEVIGKDGKKSPAPDGEHTLKDGSKLTTKGGMVVKK